MIDLHWHSIVFCHPIRKLLVSINQSSYLIYSYYNLFDRAKEIKIRNKIEETTFSRILTYFVFLVLFLKKSRLH